MVTDNHYRWDFIQLSTDTKPTPETSFKVANGSTLYTSDDSKLYVWYKDQWYEKTSTSGGGDGGVTELTTADYNWPVANPTGIAPWLLDIGWYTAKDDVKIFQNPSTSATVTWYQGKSFYIGRGTGPGGTQYARAKYMYRIGERGIATTEGVDVYAWITWFANDSSGVQTMYFPSLSVLSERVIRGAGAPTTATVGTVGTLYEDTTNGKLYQCTAVSGNTYTWTEVGAGGGSGGGIIELTSADYNYPTDNPTSVALWKLEAGLYTKGTGVTTRSSTSSQAGSAGDIFLVGEAASNNTVGITIFGKSSQTQYSTNKTSGAIVTDGKNVLYNNMIEQSAGTATTTVMSQNAVTSMVFADPSTKRNVQIGNGATASGTSSIALRGIAMGSNAIAIGVDSKTEASSAIAFAGGTASSGGVMQIGTNSTGWETAGYKSSQYRLLTGLYDPQTAHDAATKGYVDPSTDSSAPTTATVGRLGQIQIDTANNDAYMCVAVDDVTPAYTWKKITV